MKTNARNAAARFFLIALLTASSSMATGTLHDSLPATFRLDPSPRPSPPIETLVEFDTAFGGEGAVNQTRADVPMRIGYAYAAGAKAADASEMSQEKKKRAKSAVILLSVLSGIALSGLLLIIAAISIRGLQRKLAGPTRLDREPADLFPPPPGPEPDEPPAAGTAAPTDASSQETRLT